MERSDLRLEQKEAFYPYFGGIPGPGNWAGKDRGCRAGFLFIHRLFWDSSEEIIVPALGRIFYGVACSARWEAFRALKVEAERRTGKPVIAATAGNVWMGETDPAWGF